VTPDIADALRLPCAHGGPVGSGSIRSTADDFVVREWLGFEADGAGDHWLLSVRKRNANTHWVAKQLGKLAGIHPRDVGFAGLKDRNALAEQAFTVPVRSAVTDWLGVTGEGFEVIAAQRHRRKLKRGALKGNDFEIVICGFDGDPGRLESRLVAIAAHGVPNYFGPQRFGRELGNLKRAYSLFAGGRSCASMRPRHSGIDDRLERGFALSAARAYVFNAVLAQRVTAGTWNCLSEGDVANLDGSNSIFVPDAIDTVLRERCASLDIHPTGPLWGRGELQSAGSVRALEQEIAARYPELCEGLAQAALEAERRSLRIAVRSPSHVLNEGHLTLRFRLGRGAFATSVLHEILDGAFDSETPELDD
jgi:tRNA pseudouridine13 synthase